MNKKNNLIIRKSSDKEKLIKLNIFFFLFSLSLTIYLLGIEYFNPTNTNWLFWGDLSTLQTGWNYFRIDQWRFPIFSNPNYGIYLNNSLIYTDSIPLFGFFFKIINSILPENFQYFSIWILFSIYLQGLISYLIIFKITKSNNYSLISSIFFIFSSIMIHRITEYPQLSGHWIILLFIYTELLDKNKKFILQIIVFLLSLLINFYFTLMLLMIFFINQFYNLITRQKSFSSIFKESFLLLILILILMYFIGYFQISPDDGLGWGYGNYNLNLNSFFNPLGKTYIEISWSNFLPIKPLQNAEIEGFAYLGISGLIFLVFFFKHIFFGKKKIIYDPKNIFLVSFVIFILSISNNITYGDFTILNVPLNKYLYAFSSIFRSSGRLIWPIYYFIFIIGIISIYILFPRKNIFILLILLSLQLYDLSNGLKYYYNGNQYKVASPSKYNDYDFWKAMSQQFENLRLLKPENDGKIYKKLSAIISGNYFKGTDVVYLSRVNRKLIAQERYNIIDRIIKKDLSQFENTLFISDDENSVNFLSQNFSEKINIYKYKDIWLLSNKEIINTKLSKSLYLFKMDVLDLDKKNSLPIINSKIPKLGFDYDNLNKSLIINGNYGIINFKLKGDKCRNASNVKIDFEPYFNESFATSDFEIELNNEKKDFRIENNSINFDFDCVSNDINYLMIKSNKIFSEFDKKIGLNRSKKSIIIRSINFN